MGTLGATDPEDDTLAYALAVYKDHRLFNIDGRSGELTLKAAKDFETDPKSYTVEVTVSDGKNPAGEVDTTSDHGITVTVNITDVNEAPEFLSKATVGQNGNKVAPAPISADTRTVLENTTTGQDIGDPVEATDQDAGASLTYALAASSHADAGSDDHTHFTIVADSGQLQTSGALDHEDDSSYIVVVTVHDGQDADGNADTTEDDRITITIEVGDVDEPPAPPTAVSATGEVESLKVAWTAPTAGAMAGLPDVTGYGVQYRRRTATNPSVVWGDWQSHNHAGTDTEATIGSLMGREVYQAQVRSVNHEGESVWVGSSTTGSPTTSNAAPVFADDSKTVSVAENTAAATNIDNPITATDPNWDSLTYTLGSTGDNTHFAIVAGSGQLRTRGALDYERKSSYTVTVTASDGGGLSDSITVTITVTDESDGSVVDYDSDNDGLIEIDSLTQLNAIRWNLDGDGAATADGYITAFPNAAAGMGCPDTDSDAATPNCTGYELTKSLDFDQDGDGAITAADAAWWNNSRGWEPIGTDVNGKNAERYNAVFDGNGRTISNLYIKRPTTGPQDEDSGLFGATGTSSIVRNLGLEDVKISTDEEYVGALAGIAYGTVESSYSTGSVAGFRRVGGLVGYHQAPGIAIDRSYSTVAVTASRDEAGGLVGAINEGTIRASNATGSVSGAAIGGLAGINSGSIIASYATGAVTGTGAEVGGLAGSNTGTITNSYWDVTTTGIVDDGDASTGEGKTTSDLQTPTQADGYTGIYSAWNLDLDGNANTDDDPWDFGTSSQYPALKVNFDGVGAATAYEFGRQGRAAPVVNGAPTFTDGDSRTLSVAEGATDVGTLGATDPEDDTLAYALAASNDHDLFKIDDQSGELTLKAVKDYETDPKSYIVVVTVSDGKNAAGEDDPAVDDTIEVTITVTDVNEAPVFLSKATVDQDGNEVAPAPISAAARAVAENTDAGQDIGAPVAATDPDAGAALTYALAASSDPGAGSDDHTHFAIVADSGQLQTRGALDHEDDDSYIVVVTVSDGKNAAGEDDDTVDARITITITVGDEDEDPAAPTGVGVTAAVASLKVAWTAPTANAMAGLPALTGYQVQYRRRTATTPQDTWTGWQNHPHVGTATAATIGSLTPEAAYQVQVRSVNHEGESGWVAAAATGVPTWGNRAPVFPSDTDITLEVAENTAPGADIDDSPTATDPDGDSLVYTLGGTDSGHFAIVAGSGQLQTKGALNHENQDSYAVVVTASDGTLADTIAVTINVTDLNEAPSFDGGLTASVNAAENQTAVATPDAADPEGDTLTYRLDTAATFTDSGVSNDHASFTMTTAGVLTFNEAPDFEAAKNAYTLVIEVRDSKDGAGRDDTDWDDAITLTVNVTDADEPPGAPGDLAVTPVESGLDVTWTAPVMTGKPPLTGYDVERRLRSSAADAPAEVWGDWTDASHSGTTASASLGELTPEAAYQVRVRGVNAEGDGEWAGPEAGVPGQPNRAPAFPSDSVTLDVDENTAPGADIDDSPTATDPDGDSLVYTLGGTDSGHFAIVAGSGQLQTKGALNHENQDSYAVVVTASDGTLTDTIAVTINVTDLNEAPSFDGGLAASVNAAENQTAVATPEVTDPEGDTLTYRLDTAATFTDSGVSNDHASFTMTTAGVLTFNEAPDFEAAKNAYTLVIEVRDSRDAAGKDDTDWDDAITLTVNVTDADEPPGAPTDLEVTSTANGLDVAWTAPVMTGKPPLSGYDVERRLRSSADDAVSETWGTWTDVSHGDTSTSAGITGLTPGATYQVRVRGVNAEGDGEWAGPEAGVPGQPNRAPAFPSDSVTLDVDENTAPGADIDDSPTATDPDGDSLVYTLGGTDSGHFAIVAGSGQLQTKGALNHENQDSYAVVVTASDGTLTDTIAVTINVTDLNEAPSFDGGLAASVNAAENQTAVATPEVTDPEGDTLTYRLDPAASFTDPAVSNDHASFTMTTAGVLTFNEAPDFEAAKNAYTLVVEVRDSRDAAGKDDTDWDDAITLTVNVTDADEPPGAPTDLEVTSTANGLDVAWTAPVMTGKPPLSGYDVERRLRSSADDAVSETWGTWTDVSHGDTSTSAGITGLTPGATY